MQLFENVHKNNITSLELLAQINFFRIQYGYEQILEHETLIEIIQNEFEEEIKEKKVKVNLSDEGESFELTLSQSKQVLIRESKLVRKGVISFLENLEKNQSAISTKEENIKLDFMSAGMICDIMRYNDTSRALIVNKLIDNHKLNPILKIEYTKSKGVLEAPSKLLKKFNLNFSAQKLNKILLEKDFLEKKERSSKSKGIKEFKILTEKGSEFGENQVNPSNPKEIQVLFYEDKFLDLINSIEELKELSKKGLTE